MMSGPPMEFEEGWALRIGNFGRAHYWKSHAIGIAKSLCGLDTVILIQIKGNRLQPALFHPVNWLRCKRCERLAP